MKFKTREIEDQLVHCVKKLAFLAFSIDGFMQDEFGIHLIITSIIRDNSPQHANGFAFDMRNNMTDEQGDDLMKWVNTAFFYSDEKLTLVDEREKPEGETNWNHAHFHCQINWRSGKSWK